MQPPPGPMPRWILHLCDNISLHRRGPQHHSIKTPVFGKFEIRLCSPQGLGPLPPTTSSFHSFLLGGPETFQKTEQLVSGDRPPFCAYTHAHTHAKTHSHARIQARAHLHTHARTHISSTTLSPGSRQWRPLAFGHVCVERLVREVEIQGCWGNSSRRGLGGLISLQGECGAHREVYMCVYVCACVCKSLRGPGPGQRCLAAWALQGAPQTGNLYMEPPSVRRSTVSYIQFTVSALTTHQ